MGFQKTERVIELNARVQAFMEEHIYPRDASARTRCICRSWANSPYVTWWVNMSPLAKCPEVLFLLRT